MEWLKDRAAQVRYSARILYQELVAQRGYAGDYDTVKNAVRPLRAEAVAASLTQRRFETAPGQQAQIDWGQVKARLGGEVARVHVSVMRLGYSRRAYVEGFENERLASPLAAHEQAFAHFGVILPRMTSETLGFPSGVADDPVLQLAMPGGDSYEHAEERRLFYVALTRARSSVTLITLAHKKSLFIAELVRDHRLEIYTQDGQEASSEVCPSCDEGFVVEKTGPYGPFYACSRFPRCKYKRNIPSSHRKAASEGSYGRRWRISLRITS